MSGVCGHSMPVKPGCYVIFATGGYARSYVQQFFTERRIPYKVLDGCWMGVCEDSYIVHSDDYSKLTPIIWRERAVLWLGPETAGRREAWERYREGSPARYLGEFVWVTKKRALEQDAWTYDPDTGAYYVCENAAAVQKPAPFEEVRQHAHDA